MPPFTYQPFNPAPYMSSIANLLAHQNDARAQATLQSGQAWANAIQNIGQTFAALPGQIQQARVQAQQNDIRTMQVDALKREQAGHKAIDTMMRGDQLPSGVQGPVRSPLLSEDGLFDIQGMSTRLSQMGLGSQSAELLKGAETINESITKHKAAQQAVGQRQAILLGDMAHGVLRMADSGVPMMDAITVVSQAGIASGSFSEKEFAQVVDRLAKLPPDGQRAALGAFMDQAARLDKGETLSEGAQHVDRYGRVVASGAAKAATNPTEASLAAAAAAGDPAAQKALDLLKAQNVKPETSPIYREWQDYKREGGKLSFDAYMTEDANRKRPITNVNAPAMSADALDLAARNYLATGQLPPMGMGQGAQRIAIMNRAAQIDPTASLAANQATYKADAASLANLTKTEGALSAFEATAGKNLDQFLELAKALPDTGVPWLNTPVRLLSAQVVGSANMAAVNAARDVALREIARVTNDPKMNGVLSDHARAEVQALSPQNATIGQIRAVARVLKQDMANVHSSLNAKIAELRGTLRTYPAGGTQPGAGGKSDPMGIR